VAPLLSQVLPESTLRELAQAPCATSLVDARRRPASHLRRAGRPGAGGSDPTAGAVLFALEHELRGIMEDLAARQPAQLTEELSICEILERRCPAHIVLALLLDAGPGQLAGYRSPGRIQPLRETVQSPLEPPQPEPPRATDERPCPGETVLPPQPPAAAVDAGVQEFLRDELERMLRKTTPSWTAWRDWRSGSRSLPTDARNLPRRPSNRRRGRS